MTFEIELSVILWVCGILTSAIGVTCLMLYNWIQSTSKRMNLIETALTGKVTEIRVEQIVKDTLVTETRINDIFKDKIKPIEKSVDQIRNDMGALTTQINQTVNIIRTNMSDLLLKLVGK